MDLMFPPSARVSAQQITAVSNAAASRSIFTGAVRSVARAGSRWRFGIKSQNTSELETYSTRAALQAFRAAMDGQANRCYFIDPAYRQRGSFPAAELLSNNTFANGTTGWTAAATYTINVTDRLMRMQKTGNTGANAFVAYPASLATVVQYAPYVARWFVKFGRQPSGQTAYVALGSTLSGNEYGQSSAQLSASGISTYSAVPSTTSLGTTLVDGLNSGPFAGDYFETPYVSLTRCALVDNGPNMLLQSDDINNAAWVKFGATIANAFATAPDGTAVDKIVESATSSAHQISQTITVAAAQADYSVCVALKAHGTNFGEIILSSSGGSARSYFNLSTGVVGTFADSGSWARHEQRIVPLGFSWYLCCLTARKLNSDTTVQVNVNCATADNSDSYAGNTSNGIIVWRATLAQSSVPSRPSQTTTVATSGTSQTASSIHVRGLPASASGLLLPGDRVQIANQLNMVTAPLNSDAAGLGYLQCAMPWRTAAANDEPIIVSNPMGRFILTGNEGGWSDAPGILSDFDFEIEEALDA